MIKNYLKIAWRNLLKHKTFSFINILGLAIGIAACMIIFLYVRNEMTFDQYNLKSNRIGRVTTILHTPESEMLFGTTPAPLAEVLKREYPEVELTVRLEPSPQVIKFKNDIFREEAFYTADQTVFSIFDFTFLEGSAAGALQNPHTIVITETIAKKYFGTQPALGKTMVCGGQNKLITAVVRNRPANSDIQIDALLSVDFSKATSWMDDFPLYTFILFNRKPDIKNFQHKMAAIGIKYAQPELNAQGALKYSLHFELEPLSDVHFSQGKLVDTPKGNKQFNYVFALLAVFILIIALLNYINLSTAKSTERAKEVGIRKVSGALRFQLVRQFLFESFFLVAFSCLLAMAFVQIGLPFFNKLLQTKLVFDWVQGFLFIAIIFFITLVLGGLYPAFVMSGFMPVKVLKGNWRHSGNGIFLRKTVTITQFAIAAALIMGTTVIYSQMQFISKKNLGFTKDQLLDIYLPRDSAYLHAVAVFQNALRQRPEISGFTVGSGMLDRGLAMSSTTVETAGKKRELMVNFYSIDHHFLPLFKIPLLEGRNLSDSFTTDKKEAFLVNEAFVKEMGWKSGLGKSVEGFDHKGRIVGVVKNFYYKSLHNLVEPLMLVLNISGANTVTIKISPANLHVVQELYKKNFPTLPFDYSFMDDMLNKQYEQDRITMSLFNGFTILAIFVSCMGLYGLVALIAVQRTKEIGIRKVLGASLAQLLSLMTKDFVKLVFWALVIALPVAGIVMNKWLTSYAYHIPLSWWMFLIPALLVLVIALAVISREIIKTAVANPVKSLRTE